MAFKLICCLLMLKIYGIRRDRGHIYVRPISEDNKHQSILTGINLDGHQSQQLILTWI